MLKQKQVEPLNLSDFERRPYVTIGEDTRVTEWLLLMQGGTVSQQVAQVLIGNVPNGTWYQLTVQVGKPVQVLLPNGTQIAGTPAEALCDWLLALNPSKMLDEQHYKEWGRAIEANGGDANLSSLVRTYLQSRPKS